MAGRNYGTDPFGIISRGDPSARGGSSVSVGRVGNSMRDLSGRSFGSGVGATVRIPIKTVSKANGGAAKSGCSVKAYGDMIKKEAGAKPVKKARGGAGKVRKGMMSPSGDILQVVKPKKNGM